MQSVYFLTEQEGDDSTMVEPSLLYQLSLTKYGSLFLSDVPDTFPVSIKLAFQLWYWHSTFITSLFIQTTIASIIAKNVILAKIIKSFSETTNSYKRLTNDQPFYSIKPKNSLYSPKV